MSSKFDLMVLAIGYLVMFVGLLGCIHGIEKRVSELERLIKLIRML